MPRFLSLLTVLMAVLVISPAHATEPFVNNPPLLGDMVKMKLYENPEKLPEVMFSTADSGLTYLSEFKGNIIILNLWATWCPPCVKELPSLNKLQETMQGEKIKVIAVSLDNSGFEAPAKFMQDNKLDRLKPYIDPDQSMPKLSVLQDVAGIPVTLIIDPQMRLLARYEGDTDWNSPAVRAVLDYYKKHVSYSILGNALSY